VQQLMDSMSIEQYLYWAAFYQVEQALTKDAIEKARFHKG
jgi:hypothetical protein